jgi:phosphoribosylglycinamide formyltransferase-1
VLPEDDEHALSERILAQEHLAYSEAIALVAGGHYRMEGRRVLANRGNGAGKTSL